MPLYLNRREWIKILKWFLHGISSKKISKETGINRQRVLRALLIVREVISKNIPDVFSGTVEVDETYIGRRLCEWSVEEQAQKSEKRTNQARKRDIKDSCFRNTLQRWESMG